MHLFTARLTTLPCHRLEGLCASGALHLAALLFLASVPSPAAMPPREPAFILTEVSEDSLLVPDTRGADLVPETDPGADPPQGDDGAADAPMLHLGGLEVDIGRIRERRAALFAFITAPLPFVDEVSRELEGQPARLVSPFAREPRSPGRPPLRLSRAELQRIVDRSWSRRDRWNNFAEIASLIEAHDPDTGEAAALVRGHVDQNLLQPYFDARTRDPRFWVTLSLAADHAPLIEFVGRFARAHPTSRVTIELLFMLDEFAQASRDAMIMLLASDPWRLLDDTRAADAEAFLLAVSLHEEYTRWARDEGLHRTEAIRERFERVRVRILDTILRLTPDGYGASDARFLLGRIQWDRRDVPGALQWWRDLAPDGRDSYAVASRALAREATFPGGASMSAINSILGAEYRRWLTFSAARLAEFGHTFETF